MMLGNAPAADAGRALFVGRRRMAATILRWLMIIVHLIRNIPVIPAKACPEFHRRAGISVPLLRPLKTREIPAFAGMTVREQAARQARRPRLRSTPEPYFIRINGGDCCRTHPAGTASRSP